MQGQSRSSRPQHPETLSYEFVCRFGPAVWQSLYDARRWEHHGAPCMTSFPRAGRMLAGRRDAGRCRPCLRLFTWAMAVVHQKRTMVLAADRPEAYAAQITLSWVAEYVRQRRAEAHGMSKPEAKPDALVGVPLRIYRRHENDWYAELLSLMLKDAAEDGPVPPAGWRDDRFCERRSRNLRVPRSAAFDHQVRLDVAEVLRIATEVAGPAWVHKYLDAPIERRRAEHTPLRLGSDADDRAPIDPPAPGRQPSDTLADQLRDRFFTELATHRPVEAIHAAAATLVSDPGEPPARAVRECKAYIVQLLTELVCQRIGTTRDGALRAALTPAEVRELVADHAGTAAGANLDGPLLERVAGWTQRLAKPPADRPHTR